MEIWILEPLEACATMWCPGRLAKGLWPVTTVPSSVLSCCHASQSPTRICVDMPACIPNSIYTSNTNLLAPGRPGGVHINNVATLGWKRSWIQNVSFRPHKRGHSGALGLEGGLEVGGWGHWVARASAHRKVMAREVPEKVFKNLGSRSGASLSQIQR